MVGSVICVAQQKGGAGKTTLAVNLGTALAITGKSVVLVDTDPQGSLGRWFMARLERGGDLGVEFTTCSAWGVSYECEKLAKLYDYVIIDTPPKVDSDLRPALRSSDLVLMPVATSHVDLWATEGVLDLADRAGCRVMVVMNRSRKGTKLGTEVMQAARELDAEMAETALSNRVVYAETLGQGQAVTDRGASLAKDEVAALASEVAQALKAG